MEYLIKSSALILLMYLGYVLFLKKETFFNHNRWFLLVGLVTVLILPLIVIPVYITAEPITIVETPISFASYAENIPQAKPFDWLQLLTNVYLIGIIVFFIQFLLQFGSLAFLLLKNSKDKDGIYTYVIVKNKISPFSFFKWIVYNPNLFSDEELKLILNHEKVHARQWHSIDIIISRLACVLFWFNPFIWFYHKDIQQNLEYIADENAQNSSASEKNYQHLLLKASVGNQNINLTSNFYNSLIKKRILMLQKNRSKSINRWKSIFILPLLVVFLMSFNTKEIYIDSSEPNIEEPNLYETEITKNNFIAIDDKLIEVIIDKNTSKKGFSYIESLLSKEDITMTINEIERNSDGLITEIDISFKFNEGMTNYKAEDSDGIKPFYFRKDDDGTVSVGPITNEVYEVVEEEPIIEIIEEEEIEEEPNRNTFLIYENEDEIEIDADSIVIVEGQPKVRASYTFISNDTIVFNRPVNKKVKANGNVKIRNNSFTIKTDSIKIRNANVTDPIYILNGKRISKKDFKKLKQSKIKTIDIIKDKSAIKLYGKAAKDGVVVIKTEEKGPWKTSTKVNSINSFKKSSKGEVKKLIASGKKPIIVIDNEIMDAIKIKDIDYNVIKSISILKDKSAKDLYGAKAKDGAIVIFTKDKNTVKADNVKVVVSGIHYVDDEYESENAIFYYVTKDTSDEQLKLYKNKLAEHNITAKFNKVRRNNSGEITSIKISLSDKNGAKSSASWKDDDGISKILVGKKGKKLITSSSY
ncbi:MAG: M56 family peptidase [Winogradskyella sp.]|nr:MAG: M56 family peptidase [Winogradskyella sp.]